MHIERCANSLTVLLALDRCQRHFRLEGRAMFRRDRLLMLSPDLGILGRRQAESPLSTLSKFPEPPLSVICGRSTPLWD